MEPRRYKLGTASSTRDELTAGTTVGRKGPDERDRLRLRMELAFAQWTRGHRLQDIAAAPVPRRLRDLALLLAVEEGVPQQRHSGTMALSLVDRFRTSRTLSES